MSCCQVEDKEKYGSIDKQTLKTNIMIHYLSNLFVIYTPPTSKKSLKSLRINFHNILCQIFLYIHANMYVCVYMKFLKCIRGRMEEDYQELN